jgi:hypothetical protein
MDGLKTVILGEVDRFGSGGAGHAPSALTDASSVAVLRAGG